MSEFGFQSYPDMKTLSAVIPENELYLGSNAMLSHQRARNDETRDPHFGDNMMKMYMDRYFTVPEKLDEFIYMSQVMQAEAVKVGVEAHRRAKPYCMGTLYWQINDCWPVASWSSIDYYGRWKALQHYASRMFSEILVSPYEKDGSVAFKVISDRASAFSGTLELKTMTLDGKVLKNTEVPVRLDADGVCDAYVEDMAGILCDRPTNTVFVSAVLRENGNKVSENIFYPVYSNEYDYPAPDVSYTLEEGDGGCWLTFTSPVLVRNLWLESDDENAVFSDNSFTLVPGDEKKVFMKTELSAGEVKAGLDMVSINDIVRK